jgi:hypothetical protein
MLFRGKRIPSIALPAINRAAHRFSTFSNSGSLGSKIRSSIAFIETRNCAVGGTNVRTRIAELAEQLSHDSIWQTDASRAQNIAQEYGRLQKSVAERDAIAREAAAAEELLELALSERDEAIIAESNATLESCLLRAQRLEFEALMDRKFDYCDCFVEVAAGAGGDDAADWAYMLLRMYRGWGARNSFEVSDFGPNRIRLSGPVRLFYGCHGIVLLCFISS